jgi:hypothetical protein
MKKEKKAKGSLSEAAKILGSAGGQKGGPARAKILSASRRSAIAKQGAKAKHNKK